jgi:hypothetical protein
MAEQLTIVRTPSPLDDDFVPMTCWLLEDEDHETRVADARRSIRIVARRTTNDE